jgi:DNA-binding NarL/FixJ family response regulator
MKKNVQNPVKKGQRKIVVVDDHPLVRRGVAQLLSQEKDLMACGEAENAIQAMEIIAQCKPDAVILDISMKGMNGIELIKNLRKQNSKLPILVVSMHEEIFYAERSLKAGARGYLMKQEATDKVVTALRKILGGEIYLSERMSAKLLSGLVGGEFATKVSPVESLTDREFEIFNLISKGLGAKQIACDLNLSVKTIEAHKENIKAKLNLSSSAELMGFAMKWVQNTDLA